MEPNLLPCLGILLIIGIFMAVTLFATRPRCPECRGLKIRVVSKEPRTFRGIDMSTGGGGGGHAQTQTIYEVKSQCKDCGAEWRSTVSETR